MNWATCNMICVFVLWAQMAQYLIDEGRSLSKYAQVSMYRRNQNRQPKYLCSGNSLGVFVYVWHFFQPNLDVNFPINCVMDLPKALVWVGSCHEIMPNLMEKKLMRFQTQHVVYFQIPRFSCPESVELSDLSVTIPKSISRVQQLHFGDYCVLQIRENLHYLVMNIF